MATKRNKEEREDELVLLGGNRKVFPGVEIILYQEEEWDKGRIYIRLCNEGDCMSSDQFEVFIATFRKMIDIARRKQKDLNTLPDMNTHGLPQLELNYDSDSTNDTNGPVLFVVSERAFPMSIGDAERFALLMEKLLEQSRTLNTIRA